MLTANFIDFGQIIISSKPSIAKTIIYDSLTEKGDIQRVVYHACICQVLREVTDTPIDRQLDKNILVFESNRALEYSKMLDVGCDLPYGGIGGTFRVVSKCSPIIPLQYDGRYGRISNLRPGSGEYQEILMETHKKKTSSIRSALKSAEKLGLKYILTKLKEPHIKMLYNK